MARRITGVDGDLKCEAGTETVITATSDGAVIETKKGGKTTRVVQRVYTMDEDETSDSSCRVPLVVILAGLAWLAVIWGY